MIIGGFFKGFLEPALGVDGFDNFIDGAGESFTIVSAEKTSGGANLCLKGVGGFLGVVDVAEETLNGVELVLNRIEMDSLGGRGHVSSYDVGRTLVSCKHCREINGEWDDRGVAFVPCDSPVVFIVQRAKGFSEV